MVVVDKLKIQIHMGVVVKVVAVVVVEMPVHRLLTVLVEME